MYERLGILLVEDEVAECNAICREIENFEEFFLTGITNDSAEAFESVLKILPDVVILDLELHKGGGDGLDFLKRLKSVSLSKKPFILVTTNNVSGIVHKAVREQGADFIMTKSQKDYTARSVLEFIKSAQSVIKCGETAVAEPRQITAYPTSEAKEKKLRAFLMNELNSVGICNKSKGYRYLIEAVLMASEQPVRQICLEIGKKFCKSSNSVERAMQNAIDRAWATSDPEELLKHYTAHIGSDKGVPTLTEFIYFYHGKISVF